MARKKAPGKSHRNGISLKGLLRKFPDNAAAEAWFQERIWGNTPHCPRCGSTNVNLKAKHKTMPHHCRDCRRYFSIKTGTVMEGSKISYQDWAIASYLHNTNLKGISSMRLHRELEVTQTTAWFILKRLRKADATNPIKFSGIVEVDETYIGPKVNRMNKKAKAKWDAEFKGSRGTAGKIAVAGIRERRTGRVQFAVLPDTTGETFKQFVLDHTVDGTEVQTDEAKQYEGLDQLNRIHTTVNHSEKEYVRYEKDDEGNKKFITTNGCEATFGILKNNIAAVFHRVSNKHIHRYLDEVSGKRNRRNLDTIDQMGIQVIGMVGKRLRFEDLIAKTPAEIGEMNAKRAEQERREAERRIRKHIVDKEYDFFMNLYPETNGMPPLPELRITEYIDT